MAKYVLQSELVDEGRTLWFDLQGFDDKGRALMVKRITDDRRAYEVGQYSVRPRRMRTRVVEVISG